MKRIIVFALLLSIVLTSCSQLGIGGNNKTEEGPVPPESMRQWAFKARASSAYGGVLAEGNDDWSPYAATGKPDVTECKDDSHAWAPAEEDLGMQWLELEYDCLVYVSAVNIHETYGPGAVQKVELKNIDTYETIWKCEDERTGCRTKECPRYFEVKLENMTEYLSDTVRLTLDTDAPGWNEIDAVELVGYEKRWHIYNKTLYLD
ncbi:hypothetical protein JW930_02510 [Candidatus Woesearchaeota archaeon]|nr:hypothetical protein [Candidatus Woesearchaeota archaeon]